MTTRTTTVGDGDYTRAELERLQWPIAWSGTVPADARERYEAARHRLARRAIAELDEAEHAGLMEGEIAVRFKDGKITMIVPV